MLVPCGIRRKPQIFDLITAAGESIRANLDPKRVGQSGANFCHLLLFACRVNTHNHKAKAKRKNYV